MVKTGISDAELAENLEKLREVDCEVRENHEAKVGGMTYKKRCEIFRLLFPDIESRRYEKEAFREFPDARQG